MKYYKASFIFHEIRDIEIEKETESAVWLVGGRKNKKHTLYDAYCPTKAQAKQALIDYCKEHVEQAERTLNYCKERLAKAESIIV